MLCVIDIFSKYAWVVPVKDKNVITTANLFQLNLFEPNRKSNKIWVDKDNEFYSGSMKSWLQDIDKVTNSTSNDRKSIAERTLEP